MISRKIFALSASFMIFMSASYSWADASNDARYEQYSLLNPAPESALRVFCTDRPTKSNNSCTVDPGHFQIEDDFFDASFQKIHGVATENYLVSDPTLKLGLTSTLDMEVNIAPVEISIVHDHNTHESKRLAGVGDLFTRVKWNFLGEGGGFVSVALSPYIKLPTARSDLGDGAVEEGLLVPIQFNLPENWALGFNVEADDLKNQDNPKRHTNFMGAISLTHPLSKTLSGSIEIWSDVDQDPSGTIRQSSFDLALSWIPASKPNFQLDGGLNLGLNAATPAAQVYVGVSQRF